MSRLPLAQKLLFATLFWMLIATRPAAASEQVAISVGFNKLFYAPSEEFVAKIRVVNHLKIPLTMTSTTVRVYPKITSFARLGREPLPDQVVLLRTWYGELPPGVTEMEISRSLPALALDEGVYPVRVSVNSREGYSDESRGYLVVLDPKRPKIAVSLVLGTAVPPQLDPRGEFVSDYLRNDLGAPNPADSALRTIVTLLEERTSLRASLAVSPSTLAALQSLSEEGRPRVTAGQKEVPGDGGAFFSRLQAQLARPEIETLFYPFGEPSLAHLQAMGAANSIPSQISLGRAAITKLAPSKLAGIVTPDLALGLASAIPMVDSAGVMLLADRELSLASSPTPPPVALEKGRDKLLVLPVDTEVSGMVSASPPEQLPARLSAALALRSIFGHSADKGTTTLFITEGDGLISPERLRTLFNTLQGFIWVETRTVGQAAGLESVTLPARAYRPSPALVDRKYKSRFLVLSRRLNALGRVIPKSTAYWGSLERLHLLSEGYAFTRRNSPNAKLGQRYLEWIEGQIDAVYKNIKVEPEYEVTFSGYEGKIPLAIRNDNNFPVTATINMSGKDGLQLDDNNIKITLNPKDNLVTLNIKALRTGTSTMRATIRSGDKTLGVSLVRVNVSDYVRTVLVSGGAALAVLGVLVIRRRRKKV